MRFKTKLKLNYKIGDIRIIKKFLLFPRRFKSEYIRWLEYANIIEKYQELGYAPFTINKYWVEIGFADELVFSNSSANPIKLPQT